VVPELVAEACDRLGISPVRDAFAMPANHRFPAYWTMEDDAFAQSWDYATAGPLWANAPFSRLEEVVAKAALEGFLMLIIAPEWPGTQYPCWAALCALCPRRWQLPQDRPPYLQGGTDLMPAPRWRTWAFLLDSREGSQTHMPPPTPPNLLPLVPPVPEAPRGTDPGAQPMKAHRHTDTLPLGSRPGKVECRRDVQRFEPAGPPGGAPTTRPGAKPRLGYPYHTAGPPRLGPPDSLPPVGGGAIQFGRPRGGETPTGGSRPTGPPGGTYGNRSGTCTI